MNDERIIELAKQAGMSIPGPLSQEGPTPFYPHDFVLRFARLVRNETLDEVALKWGVEA